MSAQFFERSDLGAQAHRLAEHRHLGLLLLDLAPERVFGLEAGNEHGVARILDVVAEVMENASRLAHARGRKNDHRPAQIVQLLRLAGLADVAQAVEAERVFALLEESS